MKWTIGLFLLLICYSCQTDKNNEKEAEKELEKKLESLVSNSDFNGVIIIAKDTSIVYSKAVGYSDFENKRAINLNDQFVIGSISKQITAVLILREYEKGSLKLEDKISKYLKNIKEPWAENISIHHLLTHTHGIVEIDKPLEFEQGTQFQYSQLGFELLAQILESVTKKSFYELSQELFKLYGLNNSFHPESKGYKNLVKGYEEEKGKLELTSNSLNNYVAAGSFISNAEDLIKWNYLLHTHILLKKETLELMRTRYATREHPIFETIEYGYGLLFKKGESQIEIGALGYAPGFVSASYFYPKSKMNLVVLENTARNLDDFKETFKLPIELMKLIKTE